jgi:formate hydrogenlyase subunit 3/multisubunit Na+/H+ antiporter MnhD subunit
LSAFPDRTQRDFVVGTPQHFRWLQGIVVAVLFLNALDALFTLHWLKSGLAEEVNPLLSEIAESHPISFMSLKLGLVSLGSWLLWSYRHRPLAVIAIFLAFIVYYSIVLYHIGFLASLVRAMLSR